MAPKGKNKALSREVSESRGGGSERHEPSGTVSDRAKIATDNAASRWEQARWTKSCRLREATRKTRRENEWKSQELN
ncbi:hypothetical protein THARTR1_02122 [Trichoderma harzianum]|uniref:Uncharacterized protein n=1 Tax=Trichoderma harzianum TaxID=5544 RepID=A0A2K0UJL7_TRIHA|nr:hypothetical protein THARTR1_02122 [Trichoderma harzianum]